MREFAPDCCELYSRVYLSPLLPFGSRCPFSQKSRGISEASQVVKVVHFPPIFFFFLLFVQPFYLVPSFWFVYSSHNRLVRQPPLWSNLDLAADSWWTNSSIHFVAYRRPKVSDSFLFSFFIRSLLLFPPPFSDRNPVFSSSVTHPHFYYVLPFPYSPLLLLKMPGKQIGVLSATSYTRLALRYFSLCDRNSQLYLLIWFLFF